MTRPDQTVGGLHLQELIGVGAMANVFKATDTDGSVVAVKIVPDLFRGDPNRAQRWRRETEIVQALQHENVISVRRIGYDNGYPFIVMEFVSGGTVGELVHARGSVPLARGLEIVYEVGEGVAYLHSKDILHRDIQPDNILLAGPSPGEGHAIVSDFSLAFRGDQSHFTTHNAGTLAFMAPEVLSGEPSTPAADQFALGSLAFFTVAGQQPFRPAGSQLSGSTPRLTLDADASDGVAAVIGRAMERNPSDRFPSVSAFCSALLPYLPTDTRVARAQRRPTLRKGKDTASAHPPEPRLRSGRSAPIAAVRPQLSGGVWLKPGDDDQSWQKRLRIDVSQTIQCMLWVNNHGRTGARDIIARLLIPPHPLLTVMPGSAFWQIDASDWTPIVDTDDRITSPLIDRLPPGRNDHITSPLIDRLPPGRNLSLFCRLEVEVQETDDAIFGGDQQFMVRGAVWEYQTESDVDVDPARVTVVASVTHTPLQYSP